MTKTNCWEILKCGRELGGRKIAEHGVCPAATDTASNGANSGKNAGRICWAIAGTFCGGMVEGVFAKESVSCMSCDFFKKVKQEEGANKFTLLKPGQKYGTSAK